MKDLLPPAPKAYDGPHWVSHASVGEQHIFGRVIWVVKHVSDCGRFIRWVASGSGRVAITQCMPDHPDYPPDPTPAQLRQQSLDRIAAKRRRYYP